jgi:hypothetical protein
MDVEALAPALLAFSKLVKAANAELNQDRTSMRVLVESEFEHKCFSISFEAIQSVIEQAKTFLSDPQVKDATEVLAKIGVLGGAAASSLFAYLKWRNGRKIESAQQAKDSPGAIIVKVEGNGNTFNLNADIYRMSQNQDVLDGVEGTLAPITERNEARSLEFRQNDQRLEVFEPQDVKAIAASCEDRGGAPALLPPEAAGAPYTVTATLYTYGPVFDTKAPNWRFLYRKKPIYADIRATNIAAEAVARGGAFLNDRYKVKMEVTPSDKDDGTPHYRILQVLDFTPAEQQIAMPLKKGRKRKAS